jgi:hypothetical protein
LSRETDANGNVHGEDGRFASVRTCEEKIRLLEEQLRITETRFQEERDRRYAEVDVEREKALKIKEEADKSALGLAREIQTYKDEKANELRSQIERERGSYVTQSEIKALAEKIDTALQPLENFRSKATGAALVLTLVSGVVGAAIFKVLGG